MPVKVICINAQRQEPVSALAVLEKRIADWLKSHPRAKIISSSTTTSVLSNNETIAAAMIFYEE